MEERNMNDVFSTLNSIMSSTNIENVSQDGAGFSELPDGYYLCEVQKAELTASKKGDPMVKFQYKIVDDGYAVKFTDDEEVELQPISGTKGRMMFQNFVIKDDNGLRRFVSDMLKFEGDEPGEPLLSKECFTTSEVLEDALEILIGMRIYAQMTTSKPKNEGEEPSHWTNLVSWKRADKLGLPM